MVKNRISLYDVFKFKIKKGICFWYFVDRYNPVDRRTLLG